MIRHCTCEKPTPTIHGRCLNCYLKMQIKNLDGKCARNTSEPKKISEYEVNAPEILKLLKKLSNLFYDGPLVEEIKELIKKLEGQK